MHDENLKKLLYEFYSASTDEELINACENDWRYCIPKDIALDGFIPRTPYVKLEGDVNWKPLATIEHRLLEVVEEKRKSNQTTRRK